MVAAAREEGKKQYMELVAAIEQRYISEFKTSLTELKDQAKRDTEVRFPSWPDVTFPLAAIPSLSIPPPPAHRTLGILWIVLFVFKPQARALREFT